MKKIKNVLLIDDDNATNLLHQIYIERLNIVENIFIAYNGKEAIDLILDTNLKPKFKPDVIFLDINMPIMNGWEFLEQYQKYCEINWSKIIMITACINPHDQTKGQSHPYVSDYIGKPLDENKLRKTFESIDK